MNSKTILSTPKLRNSAKVISMVKNDPFGASQWGGRRAMELKVVSRVKESKIIQQLKTVIEENLDNEDFSISFFVSEGFDESGHSPSKNQSKYQSVDY